MYHYTRRGHAYRLDIHHPPWSLQQARAAIRTNTMVTAHQVTLRGTPVLLHYARRQDVLVWSPVGLAERSRATVGNVPL